MLSTVAIDQKIAVVTSYNHGQNNWCSSELSIPSKMEHEAAHEKAQNAPFSIFDWRGSQPRSQGSLLLAVAFLRDPSRGPAKEQLSLCRLRRSLATCAELLKIIPDWDPLFRQFPPSGALLHFGRHRYQRQSRHYVKARSLKQSSFSFISLRHCWELQRRQFLSSAVDSTSQFRVLPNKRTVGSLQIKNIAGASGKRLKENRPGRPTTVSSKPF